MTMADVLKTVPEELLKKVAEFYCDNTKTSYTIHKDLGSRRWKGESRGFEWINLDH